MKRIKIIQCILHYKNGTQRIFFHDDICPALKEIKNSFKIDKDEIKKIIIEEIKR